MGCSGSKKPVLPVPPPAPEQQQQGSEARTEARSAEPAHGVQAKKPAGQAIPAPVPITIVPVATAAGAAAGGASPPAEGVDVNYRPPQEGVTALISAIKRGDMNNIKELIASRPEEVNLQGLWGNTPAILAAQYAREDILSVLMESGADVSVANEAGATPLLFASMEGFVPATIKRILALGAPADPAPARVYNTRTDSHARLTPLLAAATNGNLEAVRVLLEAGVQKDRAVLATITFTEHQDASDPMVLPTPEISSVLPPPNSPTERRGVTALMAAASNGHEAVVRLLVEAGADAGLVDSWGNTALLHAAGTAKSAATVCTLLSALAGQPDKLSAVVSRANSMMITPLHAAAENNLAEAVTALAAAGANLDARTRTGETPLMRAVQKGDSHMAVVQQLLEWGASLAAADSRGRTALDLATKARRCTAVRQLLEDRGALSGGASSSA